MILLAWMLTIGLGQPQSGATAIKCSDMSVPPAPAAGAVDSDAGIPVELTRWENDVSLGVGHIRPAGDMRWWPTDRTWGFPIFDAPGGDAVGWRISGRIINPDSSRVVGESGLIETAYELATFLVLEERSDGWLRVRVSAPRGVDDGLGWVHVCHLSLTDTPMMFERWEQKLLSDSISPLFFRAAVPHVLRAEPSSSSARLGIVAGDHHLEPLEIRGDWMRARVVQPSTYCAPPDGSRPVATEGWVRWRSDDRGPWVWYYTRGC